MKKFLICSNKFYCILCMSLLTILFLNKFISNVIAKNNIDVEHLEYKVEIINENELEKAKELINNFLNSFLDSKKQYKQFITSEVDDEYLKNTYIIDKYIIKNYKRNIIVNKFGEASCTYEGDFELIVQEFNLVKVDNEIKINFISEKRYLKMNENRRRCYINTRAIYKIIGILPNLQKDMSVPKRITWNMLKEYGLIKNEIICPEKFEISFVLTKNTEAQHDEIIAKCSKHGDFFELYKFDDKVNLDFNKYNLQIDKEEEEVISKIAGPLYKTFLKIRQIEDKFYENYEKSNLNEMFNLLKEAMKIDKRLGYMYTTIIRLAKTLKNEKIANEVYNIAKSVYPDWSELKNVLNENYNFEDELEDDIAN